MPVPLQKFREIVFQMLYSYDMGHATDECMLELLTSELSVTKKAVRDAQERVHTINAHQAEIDDKISATSHSYAFERIQSVERNILRLAIYELLYDKTIPYKVVMAEAARLTRKFASKEAATFVNAILEAIHNVNIGESIDTAKIIRSAEELAEMERMAHEASLAPKISPKIEPDS